MATIEPIKSPHIRPASTLGDRVRSLRLPPEPEPSLLGNKRLWMSVGVVMLTVLAMFAWQFTGNGEATAASDEPKVASTAPAASPTPAPATPAATAGAPVASDQPVAASGEVTLQATGYVVPAHQILISPKVSGMVTLLNFEEGKRVEKGDLLAELESVDYTADVARSKAMLESAKHKLLEMENGARVEELNAARADLAEAEAQRVQLLSEYKRNYNLRSNKTVTERDFEQSESSYRAMDRRVARLKSNLQLLEEGPRKERIDGAKADVMTAEAELAKAQWRLGNCRIVAPISGTILKKNAEIGNVVNPGAFNGSFSLCEMADLSDLEVDLSVQERNDLGRVFVGQKCKVRAEAFPDRVYDGVVARLMPIADRAKGAVPVRVKLTVPAEEEGVYLKPEMSAVVSFLK